ncbi:MAG TPA: squalene synthase HpnC, partial [Myxococcota bacterium]|nr:squalene synthase HpnC [Myxococcota bacterium]
MTAAPLAADAPELLARAEGENFPVALFLLSRAQRRHLMAIYGFARLCDELGDSAPGDRLAQLDWLEADLDRAFAGQARHPLLAKLAPTLRELALPRAPFAALVEANRRDQRKTRYATWAELAEYCEYSANPVGRLVLHVFGVPTPERLALSDQVCTGLQLAEHCQDVAEDFRAGRVYLPAEDLARFGASESDLAKPSASPALRELLRFEVARGRELLASGGALVRTLSGRARLAVAGFVAGGRAALDAVEAIERAGGRVHWHQVDLTDAAQVSATVAAALEDDRRIDVLLHCAGLEISHFLPDKPQSEYDLVFDVKAEGWL